MSQLLVKNEFPYDPYHNNTHRRIDGELIDWTGSDLADLMIARRPLYDAGKEITNRHLDDHANFRIAVFAKFAGFETAISDAVGAGTLTDMDTVSITATFFNTTLGTQITVTSDPVRVLGSRKSISPPVLAYFDIPHGDWSEWEVSDVALSAGLTATLNGVTDPDKSYGIGLVFY